MANAIVTIRDTQLEKQRTGYIELSLTNFTTDAEPAIASGSVVEISGSLYSFTGNEAITGWAAVGVGDAYIKLVPDGTDPCTAEFTATAPTWSDAKQGWYDATGTDRYVAGLYKTSATEYDNKFIYTAVLRGNNTFTGDNTFSGENSINASEITGLTYGDIGTYVIAASTDMVVSTSYDIGSEFNGNTLIVSNNTANATYGYSFSSSLSSIIVVSSGFYDSLGFVGTWTLMCRVRRGEDSNYYPIGLFLRTA